MKTYDIVIVGGGIGGLGHCIRNEKHVLPLTFVFSLKIVLSGAPGGHVRKKPLDYTEIRLRACKNP